MRGEGHWRWGDGNGGSGSESPKFVAKASPLLFSEKIKDAGKRTQGSDFNSDKPGRRKV